MTQNNLDIASGRAGDFRGWRLPGLALLTSATLHALLLCWQPRDRPAGQLPKTAQPAPMLATLLRTRPEIAQPPIPLAGADTPVSLGKKVGAGDTPLQQKARFATIPDFSSAEAVPLTRSARLKLRIHITPLGRIGRIEIIESLLVPPDFLAAVSEIVSGARYLPGESAGQAIASSFDLVIDAEPPASDQIQSPLGKPKVTPSE